jgi:hypothetical protein
MLPEVCFGAVTRSPSQSSAIYRHDERIGIALQYCRWGRPSQCHSFYVGESASPQKESSCR